MKKERDIFRMSDNGRLFSRQNLIKLILPLLAEQLLAVSVGLVDTLMVSQAGDAAISGVALVDNINRLIIQVLAAIATGGAVICSQYIGKKDKTNAKKASAQLHMVMVLFALIVVAFALIFTGNIIGAVFGSVEEAVSRSATIYFTVTSLSYPFLAVYNAGAAVYRSEGNSSISMRISVIMNIINIVGNAVFVFGFNMSVFGVALATDISRVVAAVVMFMLVMSKKHELAFDNIKEFRPDTSMIGKILKIGIPSGIENGMFQIGKLLVVSMVATFGTASIAANAVGYTIIDFANIPGTSMGLALITLVGQCIGAGKKDQARYYTKLSLKIAYVGDWSSKAILFIFAGFFASCFNLSPEAYVIAVRILRCFCIVSIPVWPLSFTLPNALRAAGDVNFTMLVSIISMWVFRVGSSYLLGVFLNMGVLGVWFGMFIDWFARSVCFVIRYVSGKWTRKKALV